MNSMEEINQEIQRFFLERYAAQSEEIEIVVKSKNVPDINNVNIQNLVKVIYYLFINPGYDSCTKLHDAIRQFARAFGETEKVRELYEIWTGTKKDEKLLDIPIPFLEAIVMRDMSNTSFRIRQTYNYGRGRLYKLSDFAMVLQEAKLRFMDIFQDIYLKYDLDIPFEFPFAMQSQEQDGTVQGMPKL